MEHYLAIHPTTHSTICVFSAATPFALNGDQPTIHDVQTSDSQAWLQLQDLARDGKGISSVRIPLQIKGECERLLNTASQPDASNDPLFKLAEEIRRYHAKDTRVDDHLKPRPRKAYLQGRAYSTEKLSEEVRREVVERTQKGQFKSKIAESLGVSRSSIYRIIRADRNAVVTIGNM